MKDTEYLRKGRSIKTLNTGSIETHDSIALAKKASRALQGSSLGSGLVRVVDKFPK